MARLVRGGGGAQIKIDLITGAAITFILCHAPLH